MVRNKTQRGRALRIAVETIVLGTILLAGGTGALSNSGGGSWQYYSDITITNTGITLSDYQVLVDLTSVNFPTHVNSSGADLRFVDVSGNELSYWIESWDHANRLAKIWVKVSSVPAGNTNIRMYYGNPNAISASNGEATYELFDDFSGTDLDMSKWQGSTNYASVSGGILAFTPPPYPDDNRIESVMAFSQGKALRIRNNIPYGPSGTTWTNFGLSNQGQNPYYALLGYTDHNAANLFTVINPIENSVSTNWITDSYTVKEIMWADDAAKWYENDAQKLNSPFIGTIPNVALRAIVTRGAGQTKYTDWIFIRKYVSPEPTVIVGAGTPTVAENFTFAHITDVHIGYTPWEPVDISGFKNFTKYYSNKENLMKNSVETFTDTLQGIKIANPDRVLITGDIVEYNDKDFFIAFKNILRGFSIPVNAAPGNHDRRSVVITGDDLSNYNNYINKYINNLTNPDENNYYFDFKGYRFIGLDSGADESAYIDTSRTSYDISPEATGLSDSQMGRLRGEFNNSVPKIVFMHHPVMDFEDDALFRDPILDKVLIGVPPDGGPGGNDGAIAYNRWNFINYTGDSNVQLVLTGHRHKNAIFNMAGLPVDNSSPSRPLFIQTQNEGYRIIEVKDGKVNPNNTDQLSRFNRTSAAASFNNLGVVTHGLHAYDSLRRHTGMIACSDDFELSIPDSYYTGNYGGKSVTPEVIISYTNDTDTDIRKEITELRIFSLCKAPKKSDAAAYTMSMENTSFNLTIEKQKKTSTIEIYFYNVSATESSVAIVNVSDIVSNYKMDVDLNGDGTTDQTINPDSIDTTLAQPQNNISVIAYNGGGTINLASSSGYFISAASLNASSIDGKPPYEFPYGLLAFNISGLRSGQMVDVTLTLPQNLSSAAQYWKYGGTLENTTPHWYLVPLGSNDGDNVITLRLQDGGAGDEDQIANGIILGAGGPVLPLIGNVTGGGWITSPVIPSPKNNNKATFGFVAHYVKGMPAGTLEYADDVRGIKLHGNVRTLSVNKATDTAMFGGIAEISGVGAYQYTATVEDKGEPGKKDTFTINIPAISYTVGGVLGGGNIQIHKT